MEELTDKIKSILSVRKVTGDVYITSGREEEVIVNDKKAEKMKSCGFFGMAVRIFKDGKMGFGYSTEPSVSGVEKLVERVLSGVYADGYEDYKLPEKKARGGVKTKDNEYKNFNADKKMKKALDIEKNAAAADKRVKLVRDTTVGSFESKTTLINTSGFEGSFDSTYYYARSTAISSDKNSEEAADGFTGSVKLADVDFNEMAEDTGRRAACLLGGSSVKPGEYTLIIPPRAGVDFMELISGLFLSSNIRKGKSMFRDYKKGDTIGPDFLEIRDNALRDYLAGSCPFDGEGEPAGENVVVKGGKLNTFLYDINDGLYFGSGSTANSDRADFKSLPEAGTSNFYLAGGKKSARETLKNKKGIFINSLMGLHMADPVSGNFSLGINGWVFENGEKGRAVNETLITGNIKNVLKNITDICGDPEFYYGFGAPTIVVDNISVSGKQ